MKGLSKDNCYFIDHFFYYPNAYGSHDGCDRTQLIKLATTPTTNPMVSTAAIELNLLLDKSELGTIGDMKYCEVLWEWLDYNHNPNPTENGDGSIEAFIAYCRKNRLQQKSSVL